MVSSSMSGTKGFEIQTSDIRSPPKRALLKLQFDRYVMIIIKGYV